MFQNNLLVVVFRNAKDEIGKKWIMFFQAYFYGVIDHVYQNTACDRFFYASYLKAEISFGEKG